VPDSGVEAVPDIDGVIERINAARAEDNSMLALTIRGEKMVDIEAIADPERLRQLDLAVVTA
jgi:hypothetical protein